MTTCLGALEEHKSIQTFTTGKTFAMGFRMIGMRRATNHLWLFAFRDSFHVGNFVTNRNKWNGRVCRKQWYIDASTLRILLYFRHGENGIPKYPAPARQLKLKFNLGLMYVAIRSAHRDSIFPEINFHGAEQRGA